MTNNKWQVYRLDFADGAAYVGATMLPLHERIYCHRYKVSNLELTERLRAKEQYAATILHSGLTKVEAYRREYQEIRCLANPINKHGVSVADAPKPCPRRVSKTGTPAHKSHKHTNIPVIRLSRKAREFCRKKYGHPPKSSPGKAPKVFHAGFVKLDGSAQCVICNKKKPALAFDRDRTKKTGHDERCKDCCRLARQHRVFKRTALRELVRRQA